VGSCASDLSARKGCKPSAAEGATLCDTAVRIAGSDRAAAILGVTFSSQSSLRDLSIAREMCVIHDSLKVDTDVLVIGSGGAGMYAAIETARRGASVFLADRSLIGRGGATVMAQMTVAVALGSQVPDHWTHHFEDTLAAGRGLCNEDLARLLCEEGPDCIREMDEWGVGWARKEGRITKPWHLGMIDHVAFMSIS
jgi:hypothetical protein